jgi:hypothetical protein
LTNVGGRFTRVGLGAALVGGDVTRVCVRLTNVGVRFTRVGLSVSDVGSALLSVVIRASLLGTILLVCRRHERIMPMFDSIVLAREVAWPAHVRSRAVR